MTEIQLSTIVGILLSLIFSYVPGLSTWYDARPTDIKRMIMGGLLIVTTVAIFGLTCTGMGPDLGLTAVCSKSGALDLLSLLVAALVANQSAFLVTRG